ncbi:hypothetical protein V6U90_23460 [Micromonospora sp. CPCC 206060]|uniref:hypothetical protein n=1 Tax=Micromonospora sp. CPCC 206060 TaxID=3122406 RepID=UPI002FEF9CF3
MTSAAPLVTIGEVVTVAEADYCYGRGTLRLRITEEPVGHPALEWIELTGLEQWSYGGRWHDGRPRTALVRIAALRGDPPRRAECGEGRGA